MGRILLSICAVVVAAGLGGSAQQPPQARQHPRQQDAPANQQALIGVAEPESDRQRSPDQDQADHQPTPLERDDLTAQQAMALFAGLQVLLTFCGLLYIRWTLKETRKAVTEAAKGSEAAVKMALASQEQFISERRPWMAQRKIEPVDPMENMEFAFKVHFQNVGASPAFDVAVAFDMDVDDYSFTKIEDSYQEFLRSRMKAHRGGEVVFPGDDHTVTQHLQFSRRDLRKRDQVWAQRKTKKPSLTPRIFYAVFYRSPIKNANGTRTVHHAGGFFSCPGWKGPVLVGAPNPPDKVSMIANQTTADFLVS